MFNVGYEEIVERIKEEKQLSEEEINVRIKEKLKQLSDLISKEGAAHIVANELGVKVFEISKDIKINRLLSGMNNVILTGKIVRMNDVIEYNKNGRQGKVGSFVLGDDTGTIRVAFWDANHIAKIEDGTLKEGSILKIKNAYVRSNNGFKELHAGNRAALEINPEGVTIDVDDTPSYDFNRKKISELNDGDNSVGVLGTIVQVFEPRFYSACSNCGKKLEALNDSFQCKEHGLVKEEIVPILNICLDDGTGSIRAAAFRNHAQDLLGVEKEKIAEMRNDIGKFEKFKEELLGKQLILVGRIVKNEMFGRLEMNVQRIVEVNPEDLIKEIES